MGQLTKKLLFSHYDEATDDNDVLAGILPAASDSPDKPRRGIREKNTQITGPNRNLIKLFFPASFDIEAAEKCLFCSGHHRKKGKIWGRKASDIMEIV